MIVVASRAEQTDESDPHIRELRELLVNIQRFVPDDDPIPFQPPQQVRNRGAAAAVARPSARAMAENHGADERRASLDSDRNFRDLKKLLVNIQRFIPENDQDDEAAAGGKRFAGHKDPLFAARPAPGEVHLPVVQDMRAMQLTSHEVSAQKAGAVQLQPMGLSISPTAFVVTVLGFAVVLAGLVGLIVVSATRGDLFQRQYGESRSLSSNSASLDISMPNLIQVVPGLASDLPIRMLPSGVRRGALVLVIRGLPDEALLSGAGRLSAESWMIDGNRDLALDLTVPHSTQGTLQLDVQIRSPSGAELAHATTTLVVVSTAPATDAGQRETPLAQRLLEDGQSFLAAGEVDAARLLLQRSAQLGNSQAALELGATFDPARMSAAGVKNRTADEQRAIYWYSEAKRMGNPEGEGRLRGLGNK